MHRVDACVLCCVCAVRIDEIVHVKVCGALCKHDLSDAPLDLVAQQRHTAVSALHTWIRAVLRLRLCFAGAGALIPKQCSSGPAG